MKNTIKYSLTERANPQNPEDAKRAYPNVQLTSTLSLDDLSEHIHDHNSVFSKGLIVGVLTDMTHCVREALKEGNAVQLGVLGKFYPTLSSNGSEATVATDTEPAHTAMENFTSRDIIGYNIRFINGSGLSFDIDDLDFEYTATRAAQSATKKAQKAGQSSADWTPEAE